MKITMFTNSEGKINDIILESEYPAKEFELCIPSWDIEQDELESTSVSDFAKMSIEYLNKAIAEDVEELVTDQEILEEVLK